MTLFLNPLHFKLRYSHWAHLLTNLTIEDLRNQLKKYTVPFVLGYSRKPPLIAKG